MGDSFNESSYGALQDPVLEMVQLNAQARAYMG